MDALPGRNSARLMSISRMHDLIARMDDLDAGAVRFVVGGVTCCADGSLMIVGELFVGSVDRTIRPWPGPKTPGRFREVLPRSIRHRRLVRLLRMPPGLYVRHVLSVVGRWFSAAPDRDYFVRQRLRNRLDASRAAGPLVRWHWAWLAIPAAVGWVFVLMAANVLTSPSWLQDTVAAIGFGFLVPAFCVFVLRTQVIGFVASVEPDASEDHEVPPPASDRASDQAP